MLITEKHMDSEEYWNKFYKKKKLPLEGSTFSRFINKWIGEKALFLDIGCGSGRDSVFLADQGHEVVGIDRSVEAIESNQKDTNRQSISFQHVDLSESDSLNSILNQMQKRATDTELPFVVYLRFLLHSIDEVTEQKLISSLTKHLGFGSYIVAEFRTIEDEKRSKVYDNHYRRFIVAEELIDSLKSSGFNKEYFTKGIGLSVYKDEDPYLARIIMRKS